MQSFLSKIQFSVPFSSRSINLYVSEAKERAYHITFWGNSSIDYVKGLSRSFIYVKGILN